MICSSTKQEERGDDSREGRRLPCCLSCTVCSSVQMEERSDGDEEEQWRWVAPHASEKGREEPREEGDRPVDHGACCQQGRRGRASRPRVPLAVRKKGRAR
nr:unnamed protein product [Digitaria exilis]